MPFRSLAEGRESASPELSNVDCAFEPGVQGVSSQALLGRNSLPGFAAEWRASYGPTWWIDLAVLGVVVFLIGAMQPLSDPDLPMHLATGEWIVHHRAVPFAEPFAWTRAGAPYYAYSWALEVAYYLIMSWSGPVGLHLLEGAVLLAVAGAMLVLARAAGWQPWVALCMAATNTAAAILVAPTLRPQVVLFVLVPLAWAWTYMILTAPRMRGAVAALVLTSAAAANSHLFFVLTAAPIALVVANPPADRRRGWAVCIAVVAGWLVSPYALAWPDVFRLNFGYNALLVQPSPILEFRPGFRASTGLLLALPLALIPWAIPHGEYRRRDLVVHGTLWLTGLVAFAFAGRLLLCWWLVALPTAADALGHLGRTGRIDPPRLRVKVASYTIAFASLATLVVLMLPRWRAEGDSVSRRLPVEASSSIEPLVAWLECHVRPGAGGRIYTWFNYGSYLVWRLPGYSASIDGRTIFPDSVARAEMLTSGLLPHPRYGTWSSADLAIVPRYFELAATLDSAKSWRLAASFRNPESPSDSVGLWVKRSWWESTGVNRLAERTAVLTNQSGDSTSAPCGKHGPTRIAGA